MNTVSRYWRLIRLRGSGKCHTEDLLQVKAWINKSLLKWGESTPLQNVQVQREVLQAWQTRDSESLIARLSLRCFITYQIHQTCIQIANQFGEYHGFTVGDLLPLVLDDDGKLEPNYRPLTLEILETYDQSKAQLSTWSRRLTKRHPELVRFLIEKDLYFISPWAILNDTSLSYLQRVLREYHLSPEEDVVASAQLLAKYHQVYRASRVNPKIRKSDPCSKPTVEQLQQIDAQTAPKKVLARLEHISEQLRQYRIHARGGNPKRYYWDEQKWDTIPDPQAGKLTDAENEQTRFLERYREELPRCLSDSLINVIQNKITRLQQRTPSKDKSYVKGLALFHCEGLAMNAIAEALNLSSQVQVTRLLQLKSLRTEVKTHLLPRLQIRIRDQALDFLSPEQLDQRAAALEQALAEEVDQIMLEAQSEAKIPHGRTTKSLFAYQLCQLIHQFLTDAP
ncbi:MAG: hypothetical protein F6K04_01035 [Leptolyngbya sp. SIO4C5]|nr:hypothetical protein [Leptolyngbya sp. SIO4C5]